MQDFPHSCNSGISCFPPSFPHAPHILGHLFDRKDSIFLFHGILFVCWWCMMHRHVQCAEYGDVLRAFWKVIWWKLYVLVAPNPFLDTEGGAIKGGRGVTWGVKYLVFGAGKESRATPTGPPPLGVSREATDAELRTAFHARTRELRRSHSRPSPPSLPSTSERASVFSFKACLFLFNVFPENSLKLLFGLHANCWPSRSVQSEWRGGRDDDDNDGWLMHWVKNLCNPAILWSVIYFI